MKNIPWAAVVVFLAFVAGSALTVGGVFIRAGQGFAMLTGAMQETERLHLSGNLRHNGDAVLNCCASNVVPRYDENMNAAPDRKRAADKIDDAVALFEAIGVMGVPPEPEKKFQLMFV